MAWSRWALRTWRSRYPLPAEGVEAEVPAEGVEVEVVVEVEVGAKDFETERGLRERCLIRFRSPSRPQPIRAVVISCGSTSVSCSFHNRRSTKNPLNL